MRIRLGGLALAVAACCSPAPARALSFSYVCVNDPTCSSFNSNAYAGFQAAGNRWSSLFSDNFTLKLEIGFSSLGSGILGGANSTSNYYGYATFRTLLGLDRRSADDNQAWSSLRSDSSVPLLINRTSDNPNGIGSAVPYLDTSGTNNAFINLTTANVKALGGTPSYGSDAQLLDGRITFSSAFNWDFDPSDGITPGFYDFIGVATHEIGHTLGFISGVDILDTNSPSGGSYYPADAFYYVSPLDLYRYSATSAATAGGVIDWSADNRDKYFSLDRGITSLARFSTGQVHGDGRQASHWKDNLALGLLDPTLASGAPGLISALDARAFDVIGYDLRPAPGEVRSTSEGLSSAPGPLPLFGLAAAHHWARRLRRRLRARDQR